MSSLLDDPWVAAQIDAVVAEYRHLWTEDQIRAFREGMAWTLATHPKASRLLERERAAAIERSGTRTRTETVSLDETAPDEPALAGGKRR
jgi:hypothetical protein